MKLFRSLLVAPATIGLLTPFSVSANEVNLNDISKYSDVESIEFANSFDKEEPIQPTLLAGGEGLVESYDGGFSTTTSASFSADFVIGAVDSKAPSSGALVDWLNGDWGIFFILTAIMVVPSLIILWIIKNKLKIYEK